MRVSVLLLFSIKKKKSIIITWVYLPFLRRWVWVQGQLKPSFIVFMGLSTFIYCFRGFIKYTPRRGGKKRKNYFPSRYTHERTQTRETRPHFGCWRCSQFPLCLDNCVFMCVCVVCVCVFFFYAHFAHSALLASFFFLCKLHIHRA